ncbi:hypothetical protein H072_650 [Dactylellina haptotyla CBS 200.50]|uniref:F-box domain-containing protein n=1 Tax=Dactylellina haptotyla (strain CBS 200.50) TaxID=1284197 RepID=S8ARD2_DACHA|nr:hypothetical protein H072_650 [Dactylellina haptotyla CBS 200.50]
MAECLYIPEVLEMVLLELPAIQTIICQRVCTTWRDLIQKSPALKYYTTYGIHLGCGPQPEPLFAEHFGDPSEREGLYYPPRSNFPPLAIAVLETLWTKLAPHALRTWNHPNDQIPDRIDLESAITLLYDRFTPICERVPLVFPSTNLELKSVTAHWSRWVPSCDSYDAESRFRSLYDHRLGPPVTMGEDTGLGTDYNVRYSLKLAMHVMFSAVYTKVLRALYDMNPAVAPLHVDPQPRVLAVNAFFGVFYTQGAGTSLKIECYKVLDPPIEVRKIQRRFVGEVRYLNVTNMGPDY